MIKLYLYLFTQYIITIIVNKKYRRYNAVNKYENCMGTVNFDQNSGLSLN